MGVVCVQKPRVVGPSRRLWMPELVLYGIRLQASQLLSPQSSTWRWTSLSRTVQREVFPVLKMMEVLYSLKLVSRSLQV